MDLNQLRRDLDLIARAREQRVEIWRPIVDEQCNEKRRIYRGSFQSRAPQDEAHSEGEKTT
jgi:hypothetical protein